VFQSTTWWLDSGANVHVCSDASLFSSYQVAQDSSVLMGNGSHVSVRGVGMVDLKLTSGKIVQLKNVQGKACGQGLYPKGRRRFL
jgi:hypothetical protein